MSVVQRALRATRWVRKPLTVSQALASLAGAGALVIAGASMTPAEFGQFALFNLAYNLLTGLVRSGLYQPALIARRRLETAHVPFRYALLASSALALAMLGTIWAIGVREPFALACVSASAAVPPLLDWLYSRAVSLDRRWDAATANLLRVVLMAVAVFVPTLRSDSVLLQTYLSTSLLVPALYLLWRLPRVTSTAPYRAYARAARWQLVDYLLGQSLNTVPLLVLGAAGHRGPVAGVRLAQSLLGPLNLAFGAAAANLIADGSTRPEYAEARAVIRGGTRIGRVLSLLALGLVSVLATVVWLTEFGLKGVDNQSLLLGLVLVGASLITTGWANVHGVVLRILDRQARVTMGRAIVAVVTIGAFVAGFWWSGSTGSVVAGFLTLAVVSPVMFITMAHVTYRRIS